MSNTTDSASSEDNARQQRPDNLTDIQQRFFLIDFASLAADASEGVTTILDTIEANERYQSMPDCYNAEAHALALSGKKCESLQKLALITARLLGSHAVQEVELIEARGEHRRTQEKI